MGVFRGTILAFDTSAAHCAAAVIHMGDRITVTRLEPMQRGQAERLMPMLAEVLAEAGIGWRALDGLAVGIGPGNFTGVRIAVAAARGLALALGRPLVGISGFELLLDPLGPEAEPAMLLSLSAPRDQAYVQRFRYGIAQGAPQLIDPARPPADLEAPANMVVRGHRATEIAAAFQARPEPAETLDIARALGLRAAWRLARPAEGGRPAPLYVRPADAAPAADPPPVILDA